MRVVYLGAGQQRMSRGAFRIKDIELHRHGQLVTVVTRRMSLAFGLLSLLYLWDHPRVQPFPALAVALAYLAFHLLVTRSSLLKGRHRRKIKVAQDLADALAIGLGAAFSGGLGSPVWLLLYPHVVGVSVRGGIRYAMAMGALDSAIAWLLAIQGDNPLLRLHPLAILFCAFMAGTASSHLHRLKRRLTEMNQELQAAAERLAALNEIADAVNTSLTTEDIVRVAAAEARRLVPCDRLAIALLDEEAVELVALGDSARRSPAPFAAADLAWAFDRPLAWCEGEGRAAPERLDQVLDAPGIRSAVSIPLRSRQGVIGSLNLGRLTAQPFSAADLSALEPVARHIALALANARLLETARQRGREFQSLFEIVRGIVERLDLDALLPLVVRSLNRLLDTHYCLLLLRSGNTLVFGAQEGLEPEIVSAFQTLRLGESVTGWVAAHGQPLVLADMRTDPRLGYSRLAERYGYRSYLCVPLKRGEEVLGTLEVVTKETRRFRPEERDLMTAFAGAATVAIENARMFAATRLHLGQLEEANRRLEELDRLRREYLRNVSHEFRTPLTVIKGYAEFLQEGIPEPDSFRDIMRVILESGDRVIDLVDTLIEVSRIEQGDAERSLSVRGLDLRQVALASAEALESHAARKGVLVDLDFEGRLPLEGDEGLLLQLVKKLLDNAVKYSPPGGRVVVRGRSRGDEVRLEVEDRGIGIAPEHLPRIFEKFYMVDGGLNRRRGGTGVGLYLVKEIVRLHRGTVEVDTRPGQGCLFKVRLPRLQHALRSEARA